MKRVLIVVAWALLACGTCFAGTIKIDGKGIVRRAPDGAIITFEINALHTNMVESLRLLSAQESQIVNVLMQEGIKTNELQTSVASMSPQYHDEDENGAILHGIDNTDKIVKQVFDGYRHSMKFKLRFPLVQERIERVYIALISRQYVEDLSIRLCLLEPEPAREQARMLAVKNAKTIAESLCRAASSRIVSVLEIEYGESTRCVEEVAYSDVAPVIRPVSASEVSRPKLPPIRAEDIVVKEAVHVIWSIEDWPKGRP